MSARNDICGNSSAIGGNSSAVGSSYAVARFARKSMEALALSTLRMVQAVQNYVNGQSG
jgi:ApbE superfamily uncharacterized protein (UPF0280 family)